MLNKKMRILEKVKNKKQLQENLIVFFITLGVLILSLGVYMVGNHISFGSIILTIGSGIFYISIILFVFFFA